MQSRLQRICNKCDEYNKNSTYFASFLIIYVYVIFNFFIKFSYLINGDKASCQTYIPVVFIVGVIFWLYYILLVFCGLCENGLKRPKTGYIKLILMIINYLSDIIIIILLGISGRDNKNNNEDKGKDCLDICVKNINEKRKKKILNEISSIEKSNNLLKEENQKLIELKKTRVSNNIDDKKIEVILWYVEKIYKEKISLNILYKYLLKEIRDKCGEAIDKDKLRNICLGYIKEKFEECLTCPITDNIFINPVITPEGQTFDKYNIEKYLKKKGENPLTRKKLFKAQLIENTLIKKLCVILISNKDELSMDNFIKMRKLLINPENNNFYSNPFVIKGGDEKGETEEGMGLISEYSNKLILNIIDQNKVILSDEFLEDINEKDINHLYNTEENINTDVRLNVEIN